MQRVVLNGKKLKRTANRLVKDSRRLGKAAARESRHFMDAKPILYTVCAFTAGILFAVLWRK